MMILLLSRYVPGAAHDRPRRCRITAASLGGQAVPLQSRLRLASSACATNSPATCDNLHQRHSEAMATRYKKPRSINTVSVGLLYYSASRYTCHLHLAGLHAFFARQGRAAGRDPMLYRANCVPQTLLRP